MLLKSHFEVTKIFALETRQKYFCVFAASYFEPLGQQRKPKSPQVLM